MIEKHEQPSASWIPLRAAPLAFQARVLEEDLFDQSSAPELLPRGEIEAFVRGQLTGAMIGRADVDFGSGMVELYVQPEPDPRDEADGYDLYRLHMSAIDSWRPHDGSYQGDHEDFLAKASLIWPLLVSRFRAALRSRKWAVVGRLGSPLASKFSEINLRDFLQLRVVDWVQGIAEHPSGERIFSIFMFDPTEKEISLEQKNKILLGQLRAELKAPKVKTIANLFYRALRDEFPPTERERRAGLNDAEAAAATHKKAQAEKQEINRALQDGKITTPCRNIIHRACGFAPDYTVSHDTVAKGLRIALELEDIGPGEAFIRDIGFSGD